MSDESSLMDSSPDQIELDAEARNLLADLVVGDDLSAELGSVLKALLWNDETNLGRVFRAWVRMGQPVQRDLTELLGLNGGFVSNLIRDIKVILSLPIRTKASMRYAKPSILRLLRNTEGEVGVKKHLEQIMDTIDTLLGDVDVIVEQEVGNERQTLGLIELAESEKIVNAIYAFSYGHYILHPAAELVDLSPRFWIKVGSTSRGVKRRMDEHRQQCVTVLPEHPVLIGVWEVIDGDAEEIEKQIHQHLVAVDFRRSTSARSGRKNEWFLVTIDAISSTAQLLGLREVGVGEFN
jgi:hypothetical protein